MDTEYDKCQLCKKIVLVEFNEDGYTIANCDTCDKMCCRECLDTPIPSNCKGCLMSLTVEQVVFESVLQQIRDVRPQIEEYRNLFYKDGDGFEKCPLRFHFNE